MLSDEKLMAYADGQLDAGERARIRKLIAQEPELSARLDVFLETGHSLASVFDGHLNAPLPEKLARIARRAEPLPARGQSLGQLAGSLLSLWRPVQPFGLAAASAAVLIAAVGVGTLILRGGDGGGTQLAGLIHEENGEAAARGPLKYALESLRSGKEATAALADRTVAKIAVKLSFRNQAQDYCRQFEIGLAPSETYGGIACNSNGQWNIRYQTALAAARRSPGKVAPAGSANSAVESEVMEMMQGDALGPRDEDAMIAAGWKNR